MKKTIEEKIVELKIKRERNITRYIIPIELKLQKLQKKLNENRTYHITR